MTTWNIIIPSDEQLEEMKQTFEMFTENHTIDNRTPREMFYHGYYMALTKIDMDNPL